MKVFLQVPFLALFADSPHKSSLGEFICTHNSHCHICHGYPGLPNHLSSSHPSDIPGWHILLSTLELATHPPMKTCPKWHFQSSSHLLRISHFPVLCNATQSENYVIPAVSLQPTPNGLPDPTPSIPQIILKSLLSSLSHCNKIIDLNSRQ